VEKKVIAAHFQRERRRSRVSTMSDTHREARRQEVVVTRDGHPIAKLSPYDPPGNGSGIFGCLAGSVTVHGDIIALIDEVWDADA